MENRFRSLLLILIGVFVPVSAAFSAADIEGETQNSLIQPQIERAEFNESSIDAEDFEITAYVGYLSIEDFGVNSLLGFKLGYHVSENIYVQAAIGSSKAGKTSFEVLSGGAPLISNDERSLDFYQVNIGYNLLPGEAFITADWVTNTTFYIVAGIGNTTFAGDDRFTINYGFGYRVLFADAFTINLDFRDHVFNMDLFGEEKVTHNLEYSLALSWFF